MLVDTQNPTVTLLPSKRRRARPLFDPPIVRRAVWDSFAKLNPVTMMKNPVMFVVEVGAALTTAYVIRDWRAAAPDLGFTFQITLALVHGAVRELRRSHGGRTWKSPGRHAAQDQD
jgi:hypothetical protein